jgi:hypothetical protein
LTDEDLEWMTELPEKIFIEKYNLLVCHAGVMPNQNPLHQPRDVYMYCRDLNDKTLRMVSLTGDFKQPRDTVLWADVYNGNINIVYGHNVHSLETPHITVNELGCKTWGIDTGCVFGGNLTCLVLEDNKEPVIHQVKAEKNYFKKG